MPHIDVPGARLYYEADGHASAPALLLLHAGIANLRMWDPVIDALSAEHFVIRFDARGFGQSTADDVEYSERSDALYVLDHLGVEEATLIGCSRPDRHRHRCRVTGARPRPRDNRFRPERISGHGIDR
jgi:pimeloyl-ACP methyl ester carboxylesterase